MKKKKKKWLKNIDLKRKITKSDTKIKQNQIIRDENKKKTISIKKKRIRTTTNNNKKNEDHIWYKNKMLRDETLRQINSIKDLRPNTSQLKEWLPNLI